MEELNLIKKRVSRRSFLDEKLSDSTITQIKEIINKVNKESHLSICLIEDATQLFNGFKSFKMFSNVKYLIVLKGLSSLDNLYERIGYYGEQVILECTKLNLGTCWVGGTYDKNSTLIEKTPDEEVVCVILVGKVPEKLTAKEILIHNATHMKSKSANQMSEIQGEKPNWYDDLMFTITKAPSAMNAQKTKIIFKYNKFSVETPNESRFDLVDFGICKYHIHYFGGVKVPFGNPIHIKYQDIVVISKK